MKLKTFLKKGMIIISIVAMATILGGCNNSQGSFKEALQKEVDRRVASGELAYPSEEIDFDGQAEESMIEEEEKLVGYDLEGNPVEIDGIDVVQYEDSVRYRLGGFYQPGEYVAVADGSEYSAYYCVTIDPEGEIIVAIGSTHSSIVFDTLDGEYLEYSNCKIYPIDKAPKVEKTADDAYPESTYKIGAQIPVGEYVVRGNSVSATILADLADSDSTLAYWGSTRDVIVTVKEGEYLKATDGDIYPIDQTGDLKSSDGIYNEGMYKVGFHMPAGTYAVEADVNTAYVEIYDGNTAESKRTEFIKAEPKESFTVKDGEYVVVIGGRVTAQ